MTRHRALTAGAVVIALTMGAHAPSFAADAPTEAELIRRGVEAREQRNDQAALEAFRQAFDLYKTPRAQAQMALAEQALGRWAQADSDLRAALDSNDGWITGNRRTLEQALSFIQQHIGTLEVFANVAGANLVVDSRVVGHLPLTGPLRLAAGTAMLEVTADGYATVQRSVMIAAGQLSRETVELMPLLRTPAPDASAVPAFVAAAPTEEPPPRPSLLQSRWTFIGAAAATAIAGGIALWSGLDTLSARDKYVDAPTKKGYDDGVSRQHRTNALVGVTAVLGAATAGLGLFVTRW